MKAPKYHPSDIHWWLIEATRERDAIDAAVEDDGWVPCQAFICRYYVPLEGTLGSDWGVIINPESVKFGQLVFEHHWCGCPVEEHEGTGEMLHAYCSGDQMVDQWAAPRGKGIRKRRERTVHPPKDLLRLVAKARKS